MGQVPTATYRAAVRSLTAFDERANLARIAIPVLCIAGEADPSAPPSLVERMTVRNEDPARAIRRLRTIKTSVDATGEGSAFSYFVLSDTSDPAVARIGKPGRHALFRADASICQ